MYGSIFRMQVKPGQEQSVIDAFDQWDKERQPHVKGAIGGLLMKPDREARRADRRRRVRGPVLEHGELIGVAVFEDRASYRANADDPEQDAWFRRVRELLESDPDWEDGDYVSGDIR